MKSTIVVLLGTALLTWSCGKEESGASTTEKATAEKEQPGGGAAVKEGEEKGAQPGTAEESADKGAAKGAVGSDNEKGTKPGGDVVESGEAAVADVKAEAETKVAVDEKAAETKVAEEKVEGEAMATRKAEMPTEPDGEWEHLSVEELSKRQRKYAPAQLAWDVSSLSEDELETLKPLVHACRVVDDIFWKQASPDGLAWRNLLSKATTTPRRILFRFLMANYGRYDRLDHNAPFIGQGSKPSGANYYPVDMTKEEFEQHLAQNPQDSDAFRSNFTVIRRVDGKLTAIPYSKEYSEDLRATSQLLEQAAGKSKNESLAKYLKSRAAAFLSDDYFQSDLDWMDLDSKIEVTIGPYEVYEDELFGYKAAFECFLTVRDEEESKKLKVFESWVDKMEMHLPMADERKNFQRGKSSPLVVADIVMTSGDTRAGVQTIAFNLPNDERVREVKGTKKVMLRNIIRAKFEKILLPIASRVMADKYHVMIHPEAFFNHTLLHEMSHGIGPGTITLDGTKTTVNLALKELYPHIEEAKADSLGLYNAFYLIDEGVLKLSARGEDGQLSKDVKLSAEEAKAAVTATFLASIFRSTRFGTNEAHGKANLVIFNFLLDKKAVSFGEAGRVEFDLSILPEALRELAATILEMQSEGSYEKAALFLETFGKVGSDMESALARLVNVPVDIEPLFKLPPL